MIIIIRDREPKLVAAMIEHVLTSQHLYKGELNQFAVDVARVFHAMKRQRGDVYCEIDLDMKNKQVGVRAINTVSGKLLLSETTAI